MKIIITGAGGFLGRNLAAALLSAGHKVWNFSRSKHQQLQEMGIETTCGNLQNEADVASAFKGIDVVFHVASRVGIWGKYDEYYRTNVIGTKNVLNACRANGITKLIYTSTPSVVFDGSDICGADETRPYSQKFYNYYSETKTIAEQMVLQANDEKLSTVALRPHQIIGPDDPHLVPRLVHAAKLGRLKIVGSGKNLVDVTYIQNAVDAHILAFEKLSSQSALAGQAYFIGQERPVVLWDFINEILVRHHLSPITKKVPAGLAFNIGLFFESWYRFFKINEEPPMTRFVSLQFSRSHYFSHEKAKNDFGYDPKISIEQALDLTVRK
ncbi:MAG: NAD-dependent epimerase/dehydratase family protein [Smithella sp.]|nr:NAD-dependent epimerase/dehydratase family protein [Smithella sp.]HQI73553.1 NAD-dependent epimerase/dehydratase family protein [Smithella sp.]